jgi:hypothetical protein
VISIRSRHSRRALEIHRSAIDDLDPGCREHGVERRGELGIPVPDQELEAVRVVFEVHQQVPGLLVTHSPAGWAVMPARCTRRVTCSMTNVKAT